eukprot:scaffold6657_cov122-Isochrysis_galbana.AAC.1
MGEEWEGGGGVSGRQGTEVSRRVAASGCPPSGLCPTTTTSPQYTRTEDLNCLSEVGPLRESEYTKGWVFVRQRAHPPHTPSHAGAYSTSTRVAVAGLFLRHYALQVFFSLCGASTQVKASGSQAAAVALSDARPEMGCTTISGKAASACGAGATLASSAQGRSLALAWRSRTARCIFRDAPIALAATARETRACCPWYQGVAS